ncbi:MAG: AarF/UbiB family protein [Verrucomicrobiales bacterium]
MKFSCTPQPVLAENLAERHGLGGLQVARRLRMLKGMSFSLDRGHLGTYKDVARLFIKYSGNDEISHEVFASQFQVDGDVEPSDDAESFTRDLERLGPTYVKVGQLLSTRADLLPPSWLAALQRLQDNVAPVPFEELRETIEEELGVRASKLFIEINETPLACASLGQVHRAVLRDSGAEVVVKIQRPGIQAKVIQELAAIGEIADFIQAHTRFGRTYEPGRMVAQFRKTIITELNYTQEAANLNKLRRNLAENPLIIVPRPHLDFCSSKVLTMDYIRGTKITHLSGVVHTEIDGPGLAEAIFDSYLKQILIDGFFHADPHPGNLLLTSDHRVAMLDLGMTGFVPEGQKDHLLRLLAATSEGRSDDAADVAQKIGTPRDDYDAAACRSAIVEIVENRQGLNVEQLQIGEMVMDVTQACGRNGLRIPDTMFMLGKMLLNLDAIGKALDPQFNPDQCLRRRTGALAQRRLRDELSLGGLLALLTDVKELIGRTPSRLNDLLKMLAQNEFSFGVNAIDEDKLLDGFHSVANRITTGLILSSLIVGAAMLMNVETGFTLFGYPGLAIILFLAAALGGILLVVGIFINERGKRR